MGSSDNFCLRWNDFESNISTSFRELRDDSEFFDVTLCCDNGTDLVQAHKVILAACSPLFRKILAHQKNQQNPLLYLKGIRLKELQAVLNFMYHGEVNVAQDSLNNFLAVAEELAVKGLTTDSQGSSNAPEARKKAVAKRKSLPQSHQSGADRSNSGGGSATKKAKNEDDDDDHGGDGIDIKRIKAEPEPSGSGAHQSSAMEDIGDDSYAGEEGADDFGDGEDFEGFAQYGEGQDFDDSLAGASGSGAGADGKGGVHIKAEVHMDGGYSGIKKQRKNYPLEFKLMIIEEAKRIGNNSIIARIHGIERTCIRDWRRDELKIRAALESGQVRFRLEGGGRKPEPK